MRTYCAHLLMYVGNRLGKELLAGLDWRINILLLFARSKYWWVCVLEFIYIYIYRYIYIYLYFNLMHCIAWIAFGMKHFPSSGSVTCWIGTSCTGYPDVFKTSPAVRRTKCTLTPKTTTWIVDVVCTYVGRNGWLFTLWEVGLPNKDLCIHNRQERLSGNKIT